MKLNTMSVCLLAVYLAVAAGRTFEREAKALEPVSKTPTSMEVDLRNGVASSLPAGVTWHSALTSNVEECQCDRQGVLKLTFDPTRVRAEITLTFEHSTDWTFHVADSVTNNGYAGDSGTQQNDAEVHSINNNIYFYGRDNVGAGASYGLLHSQAGFVAVNPYSSLTLNVADELATAHNGQSFLYVNSYKLFQLNGQSDAGGVNRDVYLGMNRVVGSTTRTGSGLCRVKVQFHNTL